MSRQGRIAAEDYGHRLPSFADLSEATATLLGQKNSTLAAFLLACQVEIGLDFSPESLKRVEAWYFEQGSPENFAGFSVPAAIGFYFGEVLHRHAGFEWIVEPYPFDPTKFEIGVRRSLQTLCLMAGARPRSERNKRKQSLWRAWRTYAL